MERDEYQEWADAELILDHEQNPEAFKFHDSALYAPGRTLKLTKTTMQIHEIEYEFMPLATVEIDETKSTQPIKEMVDFWSGGEDRLRHAKGDYTKAWLTHLALHILRNGQPPEKNDEGWYPLDGTHGITLRSWVAWEPDEDAISFE